MKNIQFDIIPDTIFGPSTAAIKLKNICVQESKKQNYNFFSVVHSAIQQVNELLKTIDKSNLDRDTKKKLIKTYRDNYLSIYDKRPLKQKSIVVFTHLRNVLVGNFREYLTNKIWL